MAQTVLRSAIVITQAFVSCGNPGGNSSNAFAQGGTIPTCAPAETYHNQAGGNGAFPGGWHFGPKGSGTIAFKAGKNKIGIQPAGINYADSGDLSIAVKMADIRQADDLQRRERGGGGGGRAPAHRRAHQVIALRVLEEAIGVERERTRAREQAAARAARAARIFGHDEEAAAVDRHVGRRIGLGQRALQVDEAPRRRQHAARPR